MKRVSFPLVKTEAASGDCPLQGLLNCLKDIPEAPDRRPSPSGAGDVRLQEDPGKRNSGGKGHRLDSWSGSWMSVFGFPALSTAVCDPSQPNPCLKSAFRSGNPMLNLITLCKSKVYRSVS